jgi:uncharacterized protein (TIGR03437 family)
MLAVSFRSLGTALVLAGSCLAATFGTVVPLHGTVSDIALDESRGRLYAANFSAYRVEVISTASTAVLAPILVTSPPSAVAVSPDNRYLVIGEYQTPINTPQGGFLPNTGGLTVLDLSTNSRVHLDFTAPVLAVAFGADGQALVVTRSPMPLPPPAPPGPNVFLFNPVTATTSAIGTVAIGSQDLPVGLATFPAQIIQTGAGVSGDRNTIIVLGSIGTPSTCQGADSVFLQYSVPTRQLAVICSTSVPPLGPRVVTVDQDASNFLAGWVLFHRLAPQTYHHWAEFPQPDGAFNIGTHAWDVGRNLVYAQIPAPGDGSVLHIVDTDNLTVRERIQLPENLAGKSVMSSDMNTMYSASISGVTILPVGQLPQTPQVAAAQEDVFFQGDACNAGVITRNLDIVSLGSAASNFTLSLPQGVTGISLSATSGTTPATIQVRVDPGAFQGAKGTSQVMLTITSSTAVNLPPAVRLLINTKDFNQRGQIVNIPGKLVDMLADPARSRLYVIRQDRNLVLVYDMATLNLVGSLRTGNTPMKMSMTTDLQYLIVGNDHSQYAGVFDLNNLVQLFPILFFGDYPRTIGVSVTDIFATVRNFAPSDHLDHIFVPNDHLDHIDFANRLADTPITLDGAPDPAIFSNNLPSPSGALAESADHDVLLLVLPDGTVAEYDASPQTWVASRKDLSSLAGAYGVLTDSLFLADSNLLDAALVPIGTLPITEGTSSGAALLQGAGLRTTAANASGAGLIERIDLVNLRAYNATSMAEAPQTANSLSTPPVGQIGESILPFTRTLAVSPDQSKIFALTISGLTVLGSNFDAPTPPPTVSSIVNAADFTASVAPGGVVAINGAGFAPSPASAGAPPLPTELGNVCATVNNIALPLFSVSSSLLTAQLPFSSAGSASLVVRAPGGISPAFPFTIQDFAPAVFHDGTAGDQSGLAKIMRDDNGELVDFTNPLHPRLPITIYLTGLGATSPLPALGDAAPASPPAPVTTTPTVKLGAATLNVTFAGLVARQVGVYPVGVYQIDATVPDVVPIGTSVPLTIQQGTFSTTVQVRVVNP